MKFLHFVNDEDIDVVEGFWELIQINLEFYKNTLGNKLINTGARVIRLKRYDGNVVQLFWPLEPGDKTIISKRIPSDLEN